MCSERSTGCAWYSCVAATVFRPETTGAAASSSSSSAASARPSTPPTRNAAENEKTSCSRVASSTFDSSTMPAPARARTFAAALALRFFSRRASRATASRCRAICAWTSSSDASESDSSIAPSPPASSEADASSASASASSSSASSSKSSWSPSFRSFSRHFKSVRKSPFDRTFKSAPHARTSAVVALWDATASSSNVIFDRSARICVGSSARANSAADMAGSANNPESFAA
mmetsp:Transcript_13672/g.42329  ORF Transcript_13672/g.42329 Transcript_13672/m.42329 type:complete len:232 (+) Transcript_13672:434-1129(+)